MPIKMFLDHCPNGHTRTLGCGNKLQCVGNGYLPGDYGSRVIIKCNRTNDFPNGFPKIVTCPGCKKHKMGESEKLCCDCHNRKHRESETEHNHETRNIDRNRRLIAAWGYC